VRAGEGRPGVRVVNDDAAWTGLRGVLSSVTDDDGALRFELDRMVAEGRQAWPQLELSPEAFGAHVARCIDASKPLAAQLQQLRATDLYLACACGHRDSAAIAALERTYARQIQSALERMRNRHLLPDDFKQILRRKLFVGEEGRIAAILRYSGQGSLGAWIRVTALRTALNLTRGSRSVEQPLPTEEELFELDASPRDVELDHLKRTYRDAFRQAFLDTMAELEPDHKVLLRQSIIHGLSVREISKLHDVHHATVARWLAQIRARIIEGTRDVLRRRLAVSAQELDSIMGLIESRLEVSVARALESDPGATDR
jgi:RNA polymerase sigma-70 factor, ECF subfamily